MNKKLIGLMVVAALGLSACGGGGSAESHGIGVGGSNTTTSTTGSTTTTSTATFNGVGNHLVTYLEDGVDVNGSMDANYNSPTSADEINTLNVEGRSILLIPSENLGTKDWYEVEKKAAYTGSGSTGSGGSSTAVNPDGKYRDSTTTWKVVGNQLQYAKFGEVFDEYEKRYRFAQGDATASDQMPTVRGEVKYSGYSTYNSKMEYDTKPIKGKSEFIVDFGERAIIGQIQPQQAGDFNPITVKGVITQNSSSFEGINPDQDSNQAVMKGSFYGPNAAEMAGIYYYSTDKSISESSIDEAKPMGTFGAIKQ